MTSKDGLTHDGKNILLETILNTPFDKQKSMVSAYIQIIAYYIYLHRKKCERKGNTNDDYFKAEYLYGLNEYLKRKNTRFFSIDKNNEESEEIIDMVNNIFDRAYFLKMEHPEYSDLACFTEAEREFCDEKAIDYLAYLEYLKRIQYNLPGDAITDHDIAKKKYKEQQIQHIAYFEYQDRIARNLPGDAKTDYYRAEGKYEDWKITKEIAILCWNMSSNKSLSNLHYWGLAERIIKRLRLGSYPYKEKYPSCDQHILQTIIEVVSQ